MCDTAMKVSMNRFAVYVFPKSFEKKLLHNYGLPNTSSLRTLAHNRHCCGKHIKQQTQKHDVLKTVPWILGGEHKKKRTYSWHTFVSHEVMPATPFKPVALLSTKHIICTVSIVYYSRSSHHEPWHWMHMNWT